MKKGMVLMTMLAHMSVVAMESYDLWQNQHKEQLNTRDALTKALQEKNGKAVEEACNAFTRCRRHLSPVNTNDELLLLAQKNVKDAEKSLLWRNNTNRRSQLVAGVCACICGIAKGAYDLFSFANNSVDPVDNSFNVLIDASTIASGLYVAKLAIENGDSVDAYSNALLMKGLVEATLRLSARQANDE